MGFIIDVAGAAVLLDYSTLNSSVQPIIRESMRRLIMSSSSPESTAVLKMIQENVSQSFYTFPLLFAMKKKSRKQNLGRQLCEPCRNVYVMCIVNLFCRVWLGY